MRFRPATETQCHRETRMLCGSATLWPLILDLIRSCLAPRRSDGVEPLEAQVLHALDVLEIPLMAGVFP